MVAAPLLQGAAVVLLTMHVTQITQYKDTQVPSIDMACGWPAVCNCCGIHTIVYTESGHLQQILSLLVYTGIHMYVVANSVFAGLHRDIDVCCHNRGPQCVQDSVDPPNAALLVATTVLLAPTTV